MFNYICIKKIAAEESLGIDLFASLPTNYNMFSKEYCGPGKYFPSGPKCNFRGHQIPYYITSRPKGSIASEILKNILKYIDNIGVFSRIEGGPTPFRRTPRRTQLYTGTAFSFIY